MYVSGWRVVVRSVIESVLNVQKALGLIHKNKQMYTEASRFCVLLSSHQSGRRKQTSCVRLFCSLKMLTFPCVILSEKQANKQTKNPQRFLKIIRLKILLSP
jgi:hypothetical protein